MISAALTIVILSLLLLRWFGHVRTLPPGPVLPLKILRRLWWSKFYGKNDMEIILALEKQYEGIFSINIGYKRVIMMSDFDKVQVQKMFSDAKLVLFLLRKLLKNALGVAGPQENYRTSLEGFSQVW